MILKLTYEKWCYFSDIIFGLRSIHPPGAGSVLCDVTEGLPMLRFEAAHSGLPSPTELNTPQFWNPFSEQKNQMYLEGKDEMHLSRTGRTIIDFMITSIWAEIAIFRQIWHIMTLKFNKCLHFLNQLRKPKSFTTCLNYEKCCSWTPIISLNKSLRMSKIHQLF